MASSAIDGLISGLDTTAIIASLMQLEAAPQTLLKAKVSTTDSIVSALQGLNTKISSLGVAAKAAATTASWQAVTAASSATSVAATTTAGAQPSSLTFAVNALAARQTSVSANATDLPSFFGGATPATITLATGPTATSSVTAIDLTGVTDLAGLAKKINDAGAGVTATIVKISATESRLQLTAKATGVAAGFDLYSGTLTPTQVASADPATVLLGRKPSTLIAAAADAKITLWPGSGAPVPVTSTTNTFAGVVTGLDFTISKLETDPVTLTVARSDPALKSLASNLVDNLSAVLGEIASRTKSVTKTDPDGRTRITGGILSGDSAVRGIRQSVLAAATDPVTGISPSTVGIVLGKDGTITFDATIFAAALAADPTKVQAVISGLAARVQTVAENLSDKTIGAITVKVQGQQSYVKSLGDQVIHWDTRLEMRRAALEKQYAGLEVALGKLNSQSDWLTSQLDSLSKNSN